MNSSNATTKLEYNIVLTSKSIKWYTENRPLLPCLNLCCYVVWFDTVWFVFYQILDAPWYYLLIKIGLRVILGSKTATSISNSIKIVNSNAFQIARSNKDSHFSHLSKIISLYLLFTYLFFEEYTEFHKRMQLKSSLLQHIYVNVWMCYHKLTFRPTAVYEKVKANSSCMLYKDFCDVRFISLKTL